MKESTDMNVKDALARITEMNDPVAIQIFVTGDERKTVLDVAHKRVQELRGAKQGEQTGAITQPAADFKEGVQGTKGYVTCEDVLEKLRAKGMKI